MHAQAVKATSGRSVKTAGVDVEFAAIPLQDLMSHFFAKRSCGHFETSSFDGHSQRRASSFVDAIV